MNHWGDFSFKQHFFSELLHVELATPFDKKHKTPGKVANTKKEYSFTPPPLPIIFCISMLNRLLIIILFFTVWAST